MGRGDLAAWAAAVGGGGISVSAGATAAGDIPLQACADPGRGLSVLAAEHAPAIPSAYRPGVGGPVPSDRRDATRAAGASLHRGGAARAGYPLLAAGRAARLRALGQSGIHPTPHDGTEATRCA